MNLNYFLKKPALELLGKELQKMTKGGSCPLRLPTDDRDDYEDDD